MIDNPQSAIIFAPFWGQSDHVGNVRIDRFVRWLSSDGFHVVIVRAGSTDFTQQESWGTAITVRDPLGLYKDNNQISSSTTQRKQNKFRRRLSYFLFNPDPSVVWARAAARSKYVLEAAAKATFIISSNPPESAHLGAWLISKKIGLPHIVDMRDGWLDEPLKPILRNSAIRRWREARLESRILRDASSVLVTSDVWKELLSNRLNELKNKITVLTNGYPALMNTKVELARSQRHEGMVLVHAGRFFASMSTRSPSLLLQPLLDGISHINNRGTIRLVGPLNSDELEIINLFVEPFRERGWVIDCPGGLPRNELLELLPQSDGLLLLSETYAAIPAKLFEYIPTGRPILVVTARNSATWRVCSNLPQAFLVEARGGTDVLSVNRYFDAASNPDLKATIPNEFSESYLSEILKFEIKKCQIDLV